MAGWSSEQWAEWWLDIGGYGGAEEFDDDDWTPLHHAMQATVHWEYAHEIVVALIDKMGEGWLRAKTGGGRPEGWTALHMCANGSDVALMRATLARRLVEARALVDDRDLQGRTPFLMAAGTGAVDTARALSQVGADVFAVADDGRNAMDRAQGSSGTMARRLRIMCLKGDTVQFFSTLFKLGGECKKRGGHAQSVR